MLTTLMKSLILICGAIIGILIVESTAIVCGAIGVHDPFEVIILQVTILLLAVFASGGWVLALDRQK